MVSNNEYDHNPLNESKSFSSILTKNCQKDSKFSINDCLSSINNAKNLENESKIKLDINLLAGKEKTVGKRRINVKSESKNDREEARLYKKKLAMEKSILKKKEREAKKIQKQLERNWMRLDKKVKSDDSPGHSSFQLVNGLHQQNEILDIR